MLQGSFPAASSTRATSFLKNIPGLFTARGSTLESTHCHIVRTPSCFAGPVKSPQGEACSLDRTSEVHARPFSSLSPHQHRDCGREERDRRATNVWRVTMHRPPKHGQLPTLPRILVRRFTLGDCVSHIANIRAETQARGWTYNGSAGETSC